MHSQRFVGLFAVLTVCGMANLSAQQPTVNEVKPSVTTLAVSANTVTDLHLRPLFTTTIRLPEPVTSVAVGAPTLFEVEHSDEEPRLVFVKPSTKQPATSNLIIALQSGQEISMRLLSDGTSGASPVDFILNYEPRQSFLIGSTDAVVRDPASTAAVAKTPSRIERAIDRQSNVATPQWVKAEGKESINPDRKQPGKPMLAALGEVSAHGDDMLVAYSVLNTSDHWIEVLPPQIEINNPSPGTVKNKDLKKKQELLAEQVPIMDYRLNERRLAPGERADGALEFTRPGFKQSTDRLLLELATASAVDNPILIELPFVAPGR